MTGPGTPLRSSLPSSSSLRAGNCTPSRYLPTWAGKRFLKKSTVYRLLLLVDWRGDSTARRGTLTSALRCSAKFALTEFCEVRTAPVQRARVGGRCDKEITGRTDRGSLHVAWDAPRRLHTRFLRSIAIIFLLLFRLR